MKTSALRTRVWRQCRPLQSWSTKVARGIFLGNIDDQVDPDNIDDPVRMIATSPLLHTCIGSSGTKRVGCVLRFILISILLAKRNSGWGMVRFKAEDYKICCELRSGGGDRLILSPYCPRVFNVKIEKRLTSCRWDRRRPRSSCGLPPSSHSHRGSPTCGAQPSSP
jgi:hypothetical protein